MAASSKEGSTGGSASCKVVDSHLHVRASPLPAAERFRYFPGQEPTLRGSCSRLLPYHVFAEYEEDDFSHVDGTTEKSFVQKWDDDMEALELKPLAEFEKHVVSFNVITRERAEGADRGEERLMLERALIEHERWQSDRVRAAVLQEQREQEAAPAASVWHQAFAPASHGEGISGAWKMSAPAVVMLPQQEAASAWQLQQLGVWQTFVAPRGEGSSSDGQAAAAAAAALLQHAEGQTTNGATAAGMVQPWWESSAQRRE